MKILNLIFLFSLLFSIEIIAQNYTDSVKIYLDKEKTFERKFDKSYEFLLSILDKYPGNGIKSARKLLTLAENQGDSMRFSKSNFILGYGYAEKENFILAIDYYYKAMNWVEQHKDTNLMVSLFNNLGIALSQQGQHKKSVGYFDKVLRIGLKEKQDYLCAIMYNNLGIEFQHLKQYSISDKYLKISYAIFNKMGRTDVLHTIFMNRGVIRFEKNQYDSALYYYRQAVSVNKKYNGGSAPEQISSNIGEVFYHLGNYDSALYYLNTTMKNIDTINDKYSLRETYMHFANVYRKIGNFEKAYYYLRKHLHINNIILNDENLKRTLQSEANFNLLKTENSLKLLNKKREYEKSKNKIIYIFISITGLLLIIALLIAIRRFIDKKNANEVLTQQKNHIEEQRKEITDSINYALRIQESILPSNDKISLLLSEFALLYLPKDIVAGDFYFVKKIRSKIYFSVIDCTGHGVPGGFMSILGYNALEKCLHDFKNEKPGEILDNISEQLVSHFTQEGKQTLRDGMDMALCCLYFENGKTFLEFAGAQNPCWIVKGKINELTTRNNEERKVPQNANLNQFIELKANNQPIGYFENNIPFTNLKLEVQKGDTVWLFSDGYADQFGGPLGKKFKYNSLKNILLQNAHLSLQEIETLLKNEFIAWQGNYDQIDDVCILGVRIQ